MLAAEGRTARRALGQSLFEIMRKTPPGKRSARVMGPPRPGSAHYVFVILPQGDMDETRYRQVRRQVLEAYCMVLKVLFPEALDLVGVATEPGEATARSQDVIYIDARDWTPGDAGSGRRPPREGRAQEYQADSAIDDSGVPWVGMKTVRVHFRLCRIRLILGSMECC